MEDVGALWEVEGEEDEAWCVGGLVGEDVGGAGRRGETAANDWVGEEGGVGDSR